MNQVEHGDCEGEAYGNNRAAVYVYLSFRQETDPASGAVTITGKLTASLDTLDLVEAGELTLHLTDGRFLDLHAIKMIEPGCYEVQCDHTRGFYTS
jgi:hypothetical protein